MLKNYFKIAWRNLSRKRGFTALNMIGLSIGMAAAILIGLWIQSELTYDGSFPTSERLYQVYNRDSNQGNLYAFNNTAGPLAPALKEDIPEIEDAVRYMGDEELITLGETHIKTAGAIVDPGFLHVFGFQSTNGHTSNALTNPQGIVITQALASTLFQERDPIGKTLTLDSNEQHVVTAVIKNMPDNSRFKAVEFFLPYAVFKSRLEDWSQSWTGYNFKTYVLLKPGANEQLVNSKIKDLVKRHTASSADPVNTEIFLHPNAKWHLYSKSENGQLVAGAISDVHRMIRISIFILLIACINFMNLSTAKNEKRAREVGVRKVIGAPRSSLIFQFLGESLLLSFASAFLALALVILALPAYNALVGKTLSIAWGNPLFWISFLSFALLTGLLAGSYPAFFLSSFRPVQILKGNLASLKASMTPRKILVICQFTFAILLIICTLIIQKQIRFAKNRDLGYHKEFLVFSPLVGSLKQHYELVKNDLLESGAVLTVNKSMGPISHAGSNGWGFSWEGSTAEDWKLSFSWMSSDNAFVKTMGLKLIDGRDIDIQKYPSDSSAVLLNESAVKVMRLNNPIGSIIRRETETYHVVGVLKDFILGSPYEPIDPLIVMGPASWFNYINYRLNPHRPTAENLTLVQQIFKKYNPMYPFEYTFTDEDYQLKFEGEERMGRLSGLFTTLTILIACLGLFGLAAYTAEQRQKEISIRKVLGATVASMTTLLSTEFVKLVLIAFVIASPIAWWMMTDWLKNFTYHINIGWMVFAITGIVAFCIVVLTVSFQAIKAAIANPVENLRNE